MGRRRTVDSAAIDARVAAVLDDSPVEDDDETMAAARAAVASRDDRWYGRLVAAAHDSAVGATDSDSAPATDRDRDAVAAAATAVELVRGYCRLRADLLSALDSDGDATLATNQSTALLAGDFLHAAAFESLQSVPDSATAACVEALTGALGSVRTTFAATCDDRASTQQSEQSVVDGTAGCVGAAAATLGGALADAPDRDAAALAKAGRALAAVHATDRLLDSEHVVTPVPAHTVDQTRLRAQVDGYCEDAAGALRSLPAAVDAAELEVFASRREHSASGNS